MHLNNKKEERLLNIVQCTHTTRISYSVSHRVTKTRCYSNRGRITIRFGNDNKCKSNSTVQQQNSSDAQLGEEEGAIAIKKSCIFYAARRARLPGIRVTGECFGMPASTCKTELMGKNECSAVFLQMHDRKWE